MKFNRFKLIILLVIFLVLFMYFIESNVDRKESQLAEEVKYISNNLKEYGVLMDCGGVKLINDRSAEVRKISFNYATNLYSLSINIPVGYVSNLEKEDSYRFETDVIDIEIRQKIEGNQINSFQITGENGAKIFFDFLSKKDKSKFEIYSENNFVFKVANNLLFIQKAFKFILSVGGNALKINLQKPKSILISKNIPSIIQEMNFGVNLDMLFYTKSKDEEIMLLKDISIKDDKFFTKINGEIEILKNISNANISIKFQNMNEFMNRFFYFASQINNSGNNLISKERIDSIIQNLINSNVAKVLPDSILEFILIKNDEDVKIGGKTIEEFVNIFSKK